MCFMSSLYSATSTFVIDTVVVVVAAAADDDDVSDELQYGSDMLCGKSASSALRER